MTASQNPFHWRGTVTEPSAFIGREHEFAALFTRLATLGCVSVVGDRRIGKSSLLYQAAARAPKQLGESCRAVYLDLLSARHHTLDGLLGSILQGLTGTDGGMLGFTGSDKLTTFEAAVRSLRRTGALPVVFLDEFECLSTRPQEFGDNLLESWRSLGNDSQIAFVTSSAQPLDQVTKGSGLTSAFYNIFAQIRLGEFVDRETRAFAQYAARAGMLEPADEVFLLRVGGNHPLRLQVAAWHLFEARRAGAVDFGVLEQAAKQEVSSMMKG